MQDRDGFIWFCTETGISRFDGYQFKTYTLGNGLPDNEVFGLYQDSRGRIWISGFDGRPAYLENGRFYHGRNDQRFKDLPLAEVAFCYFEDSKGDIWMGGHHLYRYSFQEDTVTLVTDRDLRPRVIWEDKDGRINSCSKKACSSSENDFQTDLLEFELPLSTTKEIIRVDPLRSLIVHQGEIRVIEGLEISPPQKTPAEMQVSSSIGGKVTEDSTVFVCSMDGLHEWQWKGDSILPKRVLLQGKRVSDVLRDRNGNYWISTLGSGVYFAENLGTISRVATEIYPGFYTMAMDEGGTLFLGTRGGFVSRTPNGEYSYHPLPLDKGGADQNRVLKISPTPSGALWIGSDEDFFRWSEDEIRGYHPSDVKTILPRANGQLWLGHTLGLSPVEPAQMEQFRLSLPEEVGREQFVQVAQNFLKSRVYPRAVYALAEQKDGTVWIGSKDQLCSLNPETSEVFEWGKVHPQLMYRVNDLALFPDSILWVATANGLIRKSGNRVTRYGGEEGLSGDICQALWADEQGSLWVGTNNGLNRLNFAGEKLVRIQQFSTRQGLASNDIKDIIVHGDTTFVATSQGLTILPHHPATQPDRSLPIFLQSLSISGRDTALMDSFTLPYDRNDIEIGFVALDFRASKELTYSYKLVGYDSSWTHTRQTRIEYKALPPGEFQFRIYAQTVEGVNSEVITGFWVEIRPAFWQQWWFRLLIIFLALLLGGTIVLLRMNQAKRKEQLTQQVFESEQKALRAQMNPHFFFNALNSLQRFYAQDLEEDGHIFLARFSRLIRRIFENSDQTYIALAEELEAVKLYIEIERTRLRNKFDYEIAVAPGINPENVMIPSMIVQPFAENAIWHGLSKYEKGGLLQLKVDQIEEILLITIEDNGIGREEARRMNGNYGQEHRSSGIELVRSRLNVLNRKRKIEMKLKIEDLCGPDQEAAGTRIRLEIPIERP